VMCGNLRVLKYCTTAYVPRSRQCLYFDYRVGIDVF